jgi:hypothetical protein
MTVVTVVGLGCVGLPLVVEFGKLGRIIDIATVHPGASEEVCIPELERTSGRPPRVPRAAHRPDHRPIGRWCVLHRREGRILASRIGRARIAHLAPLSVQAGKR